MFRVEKKLRKVEGLSSYGSCKFSSGWWSGQRIEGIAVLGNTEIVPYVRI